MKSKYFHFLCGFLDNADQYMFLLSELHKMDFYALIPNDDNRAEDGKQLRNKFLDEEMAAQVLVNIRQGNIPVCNEISMEMDRSCSVLEMLVGLSLRLEFETADSRWEKTPSEWFWILIDNLGLSDCIDPPLTREQTNRSYIDLDLHVRITVAIKLFLERRYDDSGSGGLFPLVHAKKDQRQVEIWYQMSAYMLENYPI